MSISILDEVLTLSEAAGIWGIDPSTIRHAISNKRFSVDEVRKSSNTWLIAYEAMMRIFGEIQNQESTVTDIYTIGYEGRTIEQFIEILENNKIDAIVDVRANPFSRKKGFSKTPLCERLKLKGISYYSYTMLGTPKELRNELNENGDYLSFFDKYNKWLTQRVFTLKELQLEVTTNFDKRYCLMCFENNPYECHRSIIAENLFKEAVEIAEVKNI